MKYRAKPIVIDAWQVGSEQVPHWIDVELAQRYLEHVNNKRRWLISGNEHVTEGWLEASIGDWIIRGTHGELYPCSDEVFKTKYEPVEESK